MQLLQNDYPPYSKRPSGTSSPCLMWLLTTFIYHHQIFYPHKVLYILRSPFPWSPTLEICVSLEFLHKFTFFSWFSLVLICSLSTNHTACAKASVDNWSVPIFSPMFYVPEILRVEWIILAPQSPHIFWCIGHQEESPANLPDISSWYAFFFFFFLMPSY